MSDQVSGFKVEEDKRQSWLSLTAIWIGNMICLPALMVGGMLATGFSIGGVMLGLVIGFAIILAYMCLIGAQAADLGLPTAPMASSALGTTGSRFLISLLLAIACVGWFGVQAAVCGSSFSTMFEALSGIAIPVWLSTVFWGIIMLITAMYGYKALKYLNYVVVPLLVLILGYTAYASLFRGDGLQVVASYTPTAPMSFMAGIGIVVGSFALGGIISGDVSRFAKSRSDVVKSSVLGVLPISLIIMGLGAVSSIVSGESDITQILVKLGLPSIGLIVLILATWSTNVLNAYSGGIAVSNMFGVGESKFKLTCGIAGLIGTVLGAAGIMLKFMAFLSVLSSFIPPVAGVMIASYWIVGKGKPENFRVVEGFNVPGIISFVAGAAVAYITANVVPFFFAPVNGIVVSMVLYIILIKVIPVKAK
jgi:cytosine permease